MENRIKNGLIDIFGASNVFDDEALLEEYRSDNSFTDGVTPWFIAKATQEEEIEKLIQFANEEGLTIIPVSSKGRRYKGDTVPVSTKAVIVDMSGMDEILFVSRREKIAVIQPGVTYPQLQKRLAEEGMTISTPLAAKPGKSVLADLLDVAPRLNSNHQFNFIEPLRCTGVVWGDGNSMFTGEAGNGPADIDKQWESGKWLFSGAGPHMFDFVRMLTQSQGTMGIATWASVKCEILPRKHKLFFVSSSQFDSIKNFVDKLMYLRFSDELMIMNRNYLAQLVSKAPEDVESAISEMDEWIAVVGIAGREILGEERVKQQEEDIQEIAASYGLSMDNTIAKINGDDILKKILCEEPNEKVQYWKETYKGGFQDIFFISTLSKAEVFIGKMKAVISETSYEMERMGVYIQPQNLGASYHIEFNFPFDSADPEETEIVKDLFERGSKAMSELGAYYSRPYGIWAQLQLNKDVKSYEALKKLKKIFDPNNVMNTGKLTL